MGFVDEDKLRQLAEKATDALRHIGLTVIQAAYSTDPQSGELVLHISSAVRETAHEQLVTNEQQNAQYNRMMAGNAEASRAQRLAAIQKKLESGDILDALTSDTDECSHERQAEGLCLDCGKELDIYG